MTDSTHKEAQLRLGFAGTPQLAATVLQALLEEPSLTVTVILTQPDKPAGRGRKIAISAVKKLALEKGIKILQPTATELATVQQEITAIDILVVVAYGILLPQNMLNIPTYGCINVHTSLLPKWRGAAPIQRAIQAGDNETGISIMRMDSGLDSGNILLQKKCRINHDDSAGVLHDRLAKIASECLPNALYKIASGDLHDRVQDHSTASYAKKIAKHEAKIDWAKSANDIAYKIRAFNPAPKCQTELAGIPLKILQAEVIDTQTTLNAGEIIACNSAGIDITTGQGIIRILQLQASGKNSMPVADFLNGRPTFAANISAASTP